MYEPNAVLSLPGQGSNHWLGTKIPSYTAKKTKKLPRNEKDFRLLKCNKMRGISVKATADFYYRDQTISNRAKAVRFRMFVQKYTMIFYFVNSKCNLGIGSSFWNK